ncbi:hypothetical protein ACOCJ5_09835 [Knoellia sp. CPCC 206450]|uniref:hypothetical protein n=1 Tax=Knoellia tibetensis TaxID=3404798 RepID=UPI003B43C202
MLNRLLDPLDVDRLRPWGWVVVALMFAVSQVEKLLDDDASWIPYFDWVLVAVGVGWLGSTLREAWRHERDWRQGRTVVHRTP